MWRLFKDLTFLDVSRRANDFGNCQFRKYISKYLGRYLLTYLHFFALFMRFFTVRKWANKTVFSRWCYNERYIHIIIMCLLRITASSFKMMYPYVHQKDFPWLFCRDEMKKNVFRKITSTLGFSFAPSENHLLE